MEVGEEGSGALNLPVWDLDVGLVQTTIPEIKFNEIQENERGSPDELKLDEMELKNVIEGNECFNPTAAKVQEIGTDAADTALITVQEIETADPIPIIIQENDSAEPIPITVQENDTTDPIPIKIQENDTAEPIPITVQENDTTDPIPIKIQENDTAEPIPLTVQENDSTDPTAISVQEIEAADPNLVTVQENDTGDSTSISVQEIDASDPLTIQENDTAVPVPITVQENDTECSSLSSPEVHGLSTKCEIPILQKFQESESPKAILVKVQDADGAKFQKDLEVDCISSVVQTVKGIIFEAEKMMELSTVEMDPVVNVPLELDYDVALHPEAVKQIEAEMTDPMSQPLSQSQTLETLVKVKEILMDFIEVDPIEKEEKIVHETFDTESEYEYSTPEGNAQFPFQLTYEYEESEADSTVLEVDLENTAGEVVQANTPDPEDTTFTKAITSSPDITSSQCIGHEKFKEPQLKYEIASQELIQIPKSHDFGNYTDYFQMRDVETSITPGRFKPETTEHETDMDIQMVDTASLTIDFDKLVEDLVFSGPCSETLIEKCDLGENAETNPSQEIQYTDDSNNSTKLEVKAPMKEPKASSSTDKSSTKRKHSVNFTRCPRVYEENFDEPILSSESFIPKKKVMKENATPVPYTAPCKPFIPYLRVGLSKRTRPRQPLHENVVIKTYPDPVSKDAEDSEDEEEEEL